MLTRDIFGPPIPAAGPVFAIALTMHVAAGLTAVITGALAATAAKALADTRRRAAPT
jgi:hypothetical protein